MAAISKMMSVTSCNASHTSCKKVLGFLGGMKFRPKAVWRFSKSAGFPERPEDQQQMEFCECFVQNNANYTPTAQKLGIKWLSFSINTALRQSVI